MNRFKKSTGFSLIELMVASMAMSILALTIGSMIYFSYKGWQQNLDAVELQRTGYLAMRTIASEIRHSHPTIAPVSSNQKVLTLSADSRDNTAPRKFTISQANGLTYQEGTSSKTLIESDLLDESNSLFEYVPDPAPPGAKQNIQITLTLMDNDVGSSTTTRYIILERN